MIRYILLIKKVDILLPTFFKKKKYQQFSLELITCLIWKIFCWFLARLIKWYDSFIKENIISNCKVINVKYLNILLLLLLVELILHQVNFKMIYSIWVEKEIIFLLLDLNWLFSGLHDKNFRAFIFLFYWNL